MTQSSEKVRIGVVGASTRYGWGMRAHVPALLGLPEYELVAVATQTLRSWTCAFERLPTMKL